MDRNKLRPCVVTIPAVEVATRNYKGQKKTSVLKQEEIHTALFHRWIDESMVVSDSFIIGGAMGGQISHTYGLVEYENGEVQCVEPDCIKFTDTQNVNIELDMKEIARLVRKNVDEFYKAYFNLDGD